MARFIDTLPPPKNPLPKKIIVLSFGRNGTLGLYKSFQILGYRPYHFKECFENGISHVTICTEALEAKYFGKGKPFGKEEFDKWFQNYDCITDVSAFFAPELAAAYPEAKFIFTYRELEAWRKSIHKTFVPLQTAQNEFPLWHMRCIEPFTYRFFNMTALISRVLWQDSGMYLGPEADRLLLETYTKHNEMAVKLVPSENLLIVKLEDGLGWEQICPFLGHKIPAVPYPRGNDPNEFGKLVEGFMMKNWLKTLGTYTAIVLPIAGGIWYFVYRR